MALKISFTASRWYYQRENNWKNCLWSINRCAETNIRCVNLIKALFGKEIFNVWVSFFSHKFQSVHMKFIANLTRVNWKSELSQQKNEETAKSWLNTSRNILAEVDAPLKAQKAQWVNFSKNLINFRVSKNRKGALCAQKLFFNRKRQTTPKVWKKFSKNVFIS